MEYDRKSLEQTTKLANFVPWLTRFSEFLARSKNGWFYILKKQQLYDVLERSYTSDILKLDGENI